MAKKTTSESKKKLKLYEDRLSWLKSKADNYKDAFIHNTEKLSKMIKKEDPDNWFIYRDYVDSIAISFENYNMLLATIKAMEEGVIW